MIHSFSCKNFYSFKELTTLDFEVNNNAPKSNGYFPTNKKSDIRLSKVETVVGPNASGKTNLLKVLPFLKWLILDSFNEKPNDLIVVQSFAFGDSKEQPTELSVVFEVNEKVYTYAFTMDKQRILSEELSATGFVKEKKGNKKLFTRNWNNLTNHYILETKILIYRMVLNIFFVPMQA